jgi:hypothetical protein
MIARKLIKTKFGNRGETSWSQSLFAHLFLLIGFNLGSRPVNVESLRLDHIAFDIDSIQVDLAKTKTQQAGDNIQPLHMHSYFKYPEININLVMAIHTFTLLATTPGEGPFQLFPGRDQHARFGRILSKVLHDLNAEEKVILSCHPDDYSAYAMRKGLQTYLNSIHQGPGAMDIRMRVGHNIGIVQEAYVHAEKCCDVNISRFCAGMLIDSKEFACLCARYRAAFIASFIEPLLLIIFPIYSKFPISFRKAVYFIFL